MQRNRRKVGISDEQKAKRKQNRRKGGIIWRTRRRVKVKDKGRKSVARARSREAQGWQIKEIGRGARRAMNSSNGGRGEAGAALTREQQQQQQQEQQVRRDAAAASAAAASVGASPPHVLCKPIKLYLSHLINIYGRENL